jgi:hypothetical protein
VLNALKRDEGGRLRRGLAWWKRGKARENGRKKSSNYVTATQSGLVLREVWLTTPVLILSPLAFTSVSLLFLAPVEQESGRWIELVACALTAPLPSNVLSSTYSVTASQPTESVIKGATSAYETTITQSSFNVHAVICQFQQFPCISCVLF